MEKKLARTLALLAVIILITRTCVAETVKIGWIGPLTGPSAALGVDSLHAVKMAADEARIAGRPLLEVIAEDDQYSTPKTVAAYERLVKQQNVKMIFVLTYSGLFALAGRAERDGVLLLDPLDCDEAIAALPRNTICVAKMTEDLGRITAENILSDNELPVGILYFQDDAFPGTAAREVLRRLKANNVEPVLEEGYSSGTVDFRPLLARAKNAGVKSLVIWGYDEAGLAFSQARELGITARFYALNTIMSPGALSSARGAVDGARVITWLAPSGPKFDRFLSHFRERVGREPFLHISTIPSFDLTEMILGLLEERAPHEDIMTTVREGLYEMQEYSGISGMITIGDDGATRTLDHRTIYTLQNGRLMPLR